MLRKFKERFKKKILKTNKEFRKQLKKESPKQTTKENLGAQEMAVEKTKFFTPEAPKVAVHVKEDLPGGYGQDKIVLQVRDPHWIHAYWEVTFQTMDNLKARLGYNFEGAKRILRVYDISHIIFNGSNAHRYFDIEVSPEANNWYINTAGPGRSWCVDIGLKLASGEFIMIARSNTVHTPLEGPSWITDEEWMIPDDMFARLYGMGFGFGRSSPVGKAWQERVKRALFSGVLASPGITSVASPVKKLQARKFWLVVNTELIVYGATEPDAKVTIQGRPLKLRSDGTFSVRFALPDSKQVIPVEAISADGSESRTITPIVTKETKYSSTLRE
jgi:hypothetical protein